MMKLTANRVTRSAFLLDEFFVQIPTTTGHRLPFRTNLGIFPAFVGSTQFPFHYRQKGKSKRIFLITNQPLLQPSLASSPRPSSSSLPSLQPFLASPSTSFVVSLLIQASSSSR
jgi:hypothetical protein